MSKRILDHNPFTGVTDYFEYDSLTDETTVSQDQDIEPILERNKLMQNSDDYTNEGIGDGFWHYASLPMVVIDKWLNEGLDVFDQNNDKKLFEKINSPENRHLKTTTKNHTPK